MSSSGPPCPPAPRAVLAAVVVMALVSPGRLAAQKTDILVMRNGDRITGEIKGLSRGKLDYSTDDAGRLSIEWEKVARLTSQHVFEIEVASGRRYHGWLNGPPQDGTLVVEGQRTDTLEILSVVAISTLDAGFFQRVKAYLDVGFSFAKANKATTFNLSGEGEYRGPRLGGKLAFESYAQGQESSPTTTRNTTTLLFNRFLPSRWYASVITKAEQNDELNLALRFTAGGGVTRVFHQSNRSEFSAGAGLVGTREHFVPVGEPAQDDTLSTNLEALIFVAWDAFRFDSPKLDLSTTLTTYPSLTDLGRLRGDLSLRLKYELFKDFNLGVNVTDTFDTRPPDETASKNDFVTSLTIGWSYRR